MGDDYRIPGEADDEPSPPHADRRKFLSKSLGAFPIVWTLGNRSGWKGTSMHGTLWSSTGTDWRHRRRRWRPEWDKPSPPPPWKSGRTERSEDEERAREPVRPPRSGWDWQAPEDEWRKWRPGADDEAAESSWQWSERGGKSNVEPATPIEDTIRRKKE
jgi:hypothetical protein